MEKGEHYGRKSTEDSSEDAKATGPETLERIQQSGRRKKILDEFNRDNLDDAGPLGGDQSMAVLKDINELGEAEEQIIREGVPKISVL